MHDEDLSTYSAQQPGYHKPSIKRQGLVAVQGRFAVRQAMLSPGQLEETWYPSEGVMVCIKGGCGV